MNTTATNYYRCYQPKVNSIAEGLCFFKQQLNNCTGQLQRVSFFINANNIAEYQQQSAEIALWMNKYYSSALFEVIAQPPVNGAFAAECFFVDENIIIEQKKLDKIYYHKIHYTTHSEIHAFGLSFFQASSFSKNTEKAFSVLSSILKAEELSFSDIVRQWNYIEDIISIKPTPNGEEQNYQIFNDIRSQFYSHSDFINGYPAATGIGTKTGGFSLSFIAIDHKQPVSIVPVSNKRQVDANDYSEQVLIGNSPTKTSPKFERAKLVKTTNQTTNYISGTASIVGEKTIDCNNYIKQTTETLNNIALLIAAADESHFLQLRVYVKDINKWSVVAHEVNLRHANIPVIFVEADVCRDNLLVEIEAVAISNS